MNYSLTIRRAAAERIRNWVLNGDLEWDSDVVAGSEHRTYSALSCDAPRMSLVAVCFGRLGMAVQVERDEYGEEFVHVAWDQVAWASAFAE